MQKIGILILMLTIVGCGASPTVGESPTVNNSSVAPYQHLEIPLTNTVLDNPETFQAFVYSGNGDSQTLTLSAIESGHRFFCIDLKCTIVIPRGKVFFFGLGPEITTPDATVLGDYERYVITGTPTTTKERIDQTIAQSQVISAYGDLI